MTISYGQVCPACNFSYPVPSSELFLFVIVASLSLFLNGHLSIVTVALMAAWACEEWGMLWFVCQRLPVHSYLQCSFSSILLCYRKNSDNRNKIIYMYMYVYTYIMNILHGKINLGQYWLYNILQNKNSRSWCPLCQLMKSLLKV